LKFVIRGLTDTVRADKIYTSVRKSLSELESTINFAETERAKQQNAIFDVMGIIKIGGGMMPQKAHVSTQTELTATL
jgi:hypothetical protein